MTGSYRAPLGKVATSSGRRGTLTIGLPVLSMSAVTRSRKAISAGLKRSLPGAPGPPPAGPASSDVQPVDGLRSTPSTTTASTASLSASSVSVRSARSCLLYTSDAADEEDSVDLGG